MPLLLFFILFLLSTVIHRFFLRKKNCLLKSKYRPNKMSYNKRKVILFASVSLIILLIIVGAVFYAIILPKIQSQSAWEKYVKEGWAKNRSLVYFDLPLYSSNKLSVFSYAVVIKEIDLAKKEIKADVVVKASNPSPNNEKLLPQELTYQEFTFRIADNTVLEGADRWEDIKPEQKAVLEPIGDIFKQGGDILVLKKIRVVYQP